MNQSMTFPISRPALSLFATEPWRAAKEFFSMATMDADTSHVSLKGDGHPVIIFPGLAADGKIGPHTLAIAKKHATTKKAAERGPAIAPPEDDEDQIHEFTQRCTDVLEMYVRRYPHLWLWMHRRWRDEGNAATGERNLYPSVSA